MKVAFGIFFCLINVALCTKFFDSRPHVDHPRKFVAIEKRFANDQPWRPKIYPQQEEKCPAEKCANASFLADGLIAVRQRKNFVVTKNIGNETEIVVEIDPPFYGPNHLAELCEDLRCIEKCPGERAQDAAESFIQFVCKNEAHHQNIGCLSEIGHKMESECMKDYQGRNMYHIFCDACKMVKDFFACSTRMAGEHCGANGAKAYYEYMRLSMKTTDPNDNCKLFE